jgi:hypothetical protein
MSSQVKVKVSRKEALEIAKACEGAEVIPCRKEPGCPVSCCAYCGLYDLCNDVCAAFVAQRNQRR